MTTFIFPFDRFAQIVFFLYNFVFNKFFLIVLFQFFVLIYLFDLVNQFFHGFIQVLLVSGDLPGLRAILPFSEVIGVELIDRGIVGFRKEGCQLHQLGLILREFWPDDGFHQVDGGLIAGVG